MAWVVAYGAVDGYGGEHGRKAKCEVEDLGKALQIGDDEVARGVVRARRGGGRLAAPG